MGKIIFAPSNQQRFKRHVFGVISKCSLLRRLNTFRAPFEIRKRAQGSLFAFFLLLLLDLPWLLTFLASGSEMINWYKCANRIFSSSSSSDPETPRSCCTSYGMSCEETCCQKMEKRESFSTPRVSAQSKFATFSTSRIENRERARKKTFFSLLSFHLDISCFITFSLSVS